MTRQKFVTSHLLVAVLSVLLLSSCTNQPKSFPLGAYETRGEKHLEFFEDGTFRFGYFNDPHIQGRFETEGQEVTFHSETMIDGSMGGCVGSGTYRWSFRDKVLVMELVSDACDTRVSETDGLEYFLVEE